MNHNGTRSYQFLFIHVWLVFTGILVRVFERKKLKRDVEGEGIVMSVPIDTMMMKYRRHGPDKREDGSGRVGGPSQPYTLGLLLEANKMKCGG
jgi:hypothetical protein